jgi:hypothetical protein
MNRRKPPRTKQRVDVLLALSGGKVPVPVGDSKKAYHFGGKDGATEWVRVALNRRGDLPQAA